MAPKSGMLNNYTALKIKALPRRRLYIYVTSITIKSNSGFSLFFLFFSLFNLRRRLGVFSCPSLFSCHVWSALWIGVDGCGSSCMLHTDCRREKDDSAVIHWDASNSTVLLLIWSEPLVKPILLVWFFKCYFCLSDKIIWHNCVFMYADVTAAEFTGHGSLTVFAVFTWI